MSVYSFVRMEQLGSRWTDFHGILRLRIFRKCVEKSEVSFQSDNNNRYFIYTHTRARTHTNTHIYIYIYTYIYIYIYIYIYTFFIISRSVLLRTKNISDKVIKKFKTHISYSVTYFCCAFPLQQWLHKHTSLLLYTYVACLVTLIRIYKCSFS